MRSIRHNAGLIALTLLTLAAAHPDVPAHVKLAETMIAEIQPEHNRYKHGHATVMWAGVDGAPITENESDCTTFVTALLKSTYHFTSADFDKWFGKSSPSIGMYYDAAAKNSGLHGFMQISELKVGDLLISKYSESASSGASGHMMIVDALPVKAEDSGELQAYDIAVIDCSESPHANDIRTKPQTGVGRGTMQVYVDAARDVVEWSWSAGRHMTKYKPDERPIIFAKIPEH